MSYKSCVCLVFKFNVVFNTEIFNFFVCDYIGLKLISLSQLVTRYTRYGRFNRRHLFGLGPITQCQMVLGSADREARPAEGHTSPPGSLAIAGPNEDDAGGNAVRVPPRLPC